MVRYQVIIAYDGSLFLGFQRQARSRKARTVQGVIEENLRRLGWQGKSILFAGRTDSGVHAAGQVIAFDLSWQHDTGTLQKALNAGLPPDVAAKAVSIARPDFHPRFAAIARRYRYRAYCASERDPLQDRYAWRLWPAPSFDLLQKAAACLTGTHDFAAFGNPPRTGESTIRCVYQASWRYVGKDLQFEITANAFLYRMVRRLVAAQVLVGSGKLSLDDFRHSLGGGPRILVKTLAPPQGLVLVEVLYPPKQTASLELLESQGVESRD